MDKTNITLTAIWLMTEYRKHHNSFGHYWMVRDFIRMPDAPGEPLRLSGGNGITRTVGMYKQDGTHIEIHRDTTPLYVNFCGKVMCKTMEELYAAWDNASEIYKR